MIAADEDALICDFAETYHIYDFRALPVEYAATLAAGLQDDSRIWRVMSGRAGTDRLLAAMTVDTLKVLAWQNTENGHKGTNPPESITLELMGEEKPEKAGGVEAFDTPDDFRKAREAIINGSRN